MRKLILPFILAVGLQVALVLLVQQHALGEPPRATTGVTRCVHPSGGSCYTTIQAAINASSSGDLVDVSAHTYYEHVTMKSGVSVHGQGWANTAIDGQFLSGQPVVNMLSLSAGTVLSGVKVTRGGNHVLNDSQRGGGLYVAYGSPTINNTWVDTCTAQYGGGVYVHSGSPVFSNVPVWNSKAERGGGYYIEGSSTDVSVWGNPLVGTNGTVWWNEATIEGGGVYVYGATAELTGLRIWWNTANAGGGVYVNSSSNRVALWLNDVGGNTATSLGVSGAGFYAASATNLELVLNKIWANTTPGDGGGAVFANSTGIVELNHFLDNTSSGSGGGASVFGASTSGLTVKGNLFRGNTAAGGGGGLYLDTDSAPLVDSNTIVTNTASAGAGIQAYQTGAAMVTNNVIARNISTADLGAGVGVGESPVQLINNTIADNTHSSDEGDGIQFSKAEGLRIVNNVISGNSGDGVAQYTSEGTTADYTVAYNDVYNNSGSAYENVTAGAGNLALNPQFAASGATMTAYYHIQPTSPIAETGSTGWAPSRDIDGDLRFLGGSVSMGADELAVTEYNVYLPLVLKAAE